MTDIIPLCNSAELVEGGQAVSFDVVHQGESMRAFAIRFEGAPHAYLNRCTHIAMEMDYQPDTGDCAGGPCRGALVKITLSEHDGVVRWHTDWNLQPLAF